MDCFGPVAPKYVKLLSRKDTELNELVSHDSLQFLLL